MLCYFAAPLFGAAQRCFNAALTARLEELGVHMCVELCMAYACKWLGRAPKTIIGLLTDKRAAFVGEKLNPMVARPLDHRVESEEELVSLVCTLVGGRP